MVPYNGDVFFALFITLDSPMQWLSFTEHLVVAGLISALLSVYDVTRPLYIKYFHNLT